MIYVVRFSALQITPDIMSAINIEKFFEKIDADNSGSITVGELTGLFKKFDKDGKFRFWFKRISKVEKDWIRQNCNMNPLQKGFQFSFVC